MTNHDATTPSLSHSGSFEGGLSEDGSATGPGLVSEHHARLWLQSRMDGRHRCVLWANGDDGFQAEVSWNVQRPAGSRGTSSIAYPDDFVDAPPLPADTTINYVIEDDQGRLGQGRFHTAPTDSSAQEFTIAFLSCHQPYQERNEIDPESQMALDRLSTVLTDYGVTRVLCLGDQMYADKPEDQSLFDPDYFRRVAPMGKNSLFECDAAQVRSVYQERYPKSWALSGFRQVLANWATTMIADDHEFVDNFGSAPEHSEPRWAELRAGSLQAAFDYEGLRQEPRREVRPTSRHFRWEYGPVATFVMDLRSDRHTTEHQLQFFEQGQLRELEEYLEQQAHKPIFLLGLSVPLAFSPEALVDAGIELTGEGTDFAERWWNDKAARDRKALVSVIRRHLDAHPEQIFIMVGGDVHNGSVSEVFFGERPTYQLISSAVSNVQDRLSKMVAEKIPELGPWENGEMSWDLMPNQLDGHNPYTGLNVGLLTVSKSGDELDVRLRIVGLSEPDAPTVVFESKPLQSENDARASSGDVSGTEADS